MGWQSKLFEKRFYYLVGLAGVSSLENKAAQRAGSIFSGLMVLVAMMLLVEWQWQLLREITPLTSFIMNWIVFMFFVVALVTEFLLVDMRARFLAYNWALPIIILGGVPFVIDYKPMLAPLSALRPLLAIYILFPSLRTLISFFFDGDLRTTLLGAAVVIVIFGILVSGIDPSVKSVWDGIWWAIATVSTIGYGDVVPSSALGRLLGVMLVILGVAIFVIITANILAYTLKKDRKTIGKEEKEIRELTKDIKDIKKMQHEQNKLIKKMTDQLNNKKNEDTP